MMRQLSVTNPGPDQIWSGLLQSTWHSSELPLLCTYPYDLSVAGRPPMIIHAACDPCHTFDQHIRANDTTSFGRAFHVGTHSHVCLQSVTLIQIFSYNKSRRDYATISSTVGSSFTEGAEGAYYNIWGEKVNQGMSDDELELQQLLANSLDDNFEYFIKKYEGLAYKIALSRINDEQGAADVVQEAFISAYKFLKDRSGSQILTMKLKPWLCTIIINACKRYYRRKKDTPPPSAFLPLEDILDVPHSNPYQQPEIIIEYIDFLTEAFLSLPEPYRVPCILHYWDCLKDDEIAESLNQPVGTIKSQISRGTKLLRKSLKRQMKEED